jgi:hypothetical protein
MTQIHWVARQNKLEIPRDKDEDNEKSTIVFDQVFHFLVRIFSGKSKKI